MIWLPQERTPGLLLEQRGVSLPQGVAVSLGVIAAICQAGPGSGRAGTAGRHRRQPAVRSPQSAVGSRQSAIGCSPGHMSPSASLSWSARPNTGTGRGRAPRSPLPAPPPSGRSILGPAEVRPSRHTGTILRPHRARVWPQTSRHGRSECESNYFSCCSCCTCFSCSSCFLLLLLLLSHNVGSRLDCGLMADG
jgi:hypothetical protein